MRHLPRLLAALAFLSICSLAAGCSGTDEPVESEGTTADELVTSNGRTAFHYFVGKGLTKVQAAAIVGNLQQESGIDPTSVQPRGPGRGIAQWSNGARWNVSRHDNVTWYASQHGASVHSLSLQLDFIWYELETFSEYGLSSLRHASTISSATYVFQQDFEACGQCDPSRRLRFAKAALAAYGNGP